MIERSSSLPQHDLLLAVIESIRDPFLILDPDLTVRLANESFFRVFQVGRDETEGRLVYDLGDGQWNIPELRNLLGDILPKSGRFDRFTVDHLFPNIGRKVMLLHARQVSLAGSPQALILLAIEDVTEQKEQESQIRRLTVTLEEKVAERTAELSGALRELESFAYSIAHDLRAPLRGMAGLSDLIREEHAAGIDEEGKAFLLKIRASAAQMDRLIQDLLVYSRLTREGLDLEPLELSSVLEEALGQLAGSIQESRAEIAIEKDLPRVRGNKVALLQALMNLLSNAIKFVPPGVRPSIRVRAEPRNENVRLWVEANGIGIAAEHHGRIFGVFQRLHAASSYPGTGIGLALVKKAAERMEGQVGLDSEPGRGSRFWIELQSGERKHESRKHTRPFGRRRAQ